MYTLLKIYVVGCFLFVAIFRPNVSPTPVTGVMFAIWVAGLIDIILNNIQAFFDYLDRKRMGR